MKGRRGRQKRQGRRAHHAGRAHGADDLHVLEADPLEVRVEVALVGDELLQERDQLHRVVPVRSHKAHSAHTAHTRM